MNKIRFDQRAVFFEMDAFLQDAELVSAVQACVEVQKRSALGKLPEIFKPNDKALEEVSKEALDGILASKTDINGIRTERHISNVIVFNDARFENAILGEEIKKAREHADRIVEKKLREIFDDHEKLLVQPSGFFLYPPYGYMGWHTNSESPGWRFYVNTSEEPGSSFIRYRHPFTGEIVTSRDKEMNFRLFRVSRENPIWHAVYSETYRFSLGYRVFKKPSLPARIWKKFLNAANRRK